jgi:hypothetical protein
VRSAVHRLTPRTIARAVDVEALDGAEPGVDVSVMLGETLIYAGFLCPSRDFVIGEEAGASFAIGEDVLGLRRLPFVLSRGGNPACSIPAGAAFELARGRSLDPRPELRLRSSAAVVGAREIDLEPGETLRVRHRAFTFVASARTPERRGRWRDELGSFAMPLAFLGTLVLLAAAVLFSLGP